MNAPSLTQEADHCRVGYGGRKQGATSVLIKRETAEYIEQLPSFGTAAFRGSCVGLYAPTWKDVHNTLEGKGDYILIPTSFKYVHTYVI